MDIGSRIKRVRQEQGLTLKMVESRSGVSAAHLSEIERGETSPTLGLLSRIASALGKSPAFFLEENELADVCHVGDKNRVREVAGGKGAERKSAAAIERLTAGIPGGRLQVRRVELSPGSTYRENRHSHAGSEAVIVLRGCVRMVIDEQSLDLSPGDAVHFDASLPHGYVNASHDEPTVLVWVATRRDVE